MQEHGVIVDFFINFNVGQCGFRRNLENNSTVPSREKFLLIIFVESSERSGLGNWPSPTLVGSVKCNSKPAQPAVACILLKQFNNDTRAFFPFFR